MATTEQDEAGKETGSNGVMERSAETQDKVQESKILTVSLFVQTWLQDSLIGVR